MAIKKIPALQITDINLLDSRLTTIEGDVTDNTTDISGLETNKQDKFSCKTASLTTLALQLSSFDGNNAIFVNLSSNTAFTFADDLKTGQTYNILIKNGHATDSISTTFPAPVIVDAEPAYVVASKKVWYQVRWLSFTDCTGWLIDFKGQLTRRAT